MASIISKVTELDKQMRQKVNKLKEEKEKLPIFLREQRKEITKKYESEAKSFIQSKKVKNDNELKSAKKSAIKELELAIKDIEKAYDENKDKWINEIYKQCIEDYSKE